MPEGAALIVRVGAYVDESLASTYSAVGGIPIITLLLIGLQSHFGDKPLKFYVVCPPNGTAVQKGLKCGRGHASRVRYGGSTFGPSIL